MKTYPHLITLHDGNCRKVDSVEFNHSHTEEQLKRKAYSMLVEHMKSHIAGMVTISGPCGRIEIYQNESDFEPTEHRQGRVVQLL